MSRPYRDAFVLRTVPVPVEDRSPITPEHCWYVPGELAGMLAGIPWLLIEGYEYRVRMLPDPPGTWVVERRTIGAP